MKIVDVIPLVYIPRHLPQVYTYFTTKPVNKYSLVIINFRKKNIRGLVIKEQNLNKLEIKKKLHYQLKPINRVLQYEPGLHNMQMKLAKWISNYYFEPISLVLKILIRKKKNKKIIILKPKKGMLDNLFSFAENLEKIIIKDKYNNNYKLIKRPRLDLRKIAEKIAKISGAELIKEEIIINKNKIKLVTSPKDLLIADYLVFNRLGHSTLIRCADCGFIKKCNYCDVPMVYHLRENNLLCHHCSYQEKPLLICKKCKGVNIHYLGQGIERFKDKKIYTFNKNLKPANIIGIVSVDHVLNLPDYRAPEKVWHMLIKLNNLAKKQLLIHTYNPQHYVFDIQNFWQKHQIIKASLVKLAYRHKNSNIAQKTAILTAKKLKPYLGPAPAFIPKKRGFYCWNMILKNLKTLPYLGPGWDIDRDPVDLL